MARRISKVEISGLQDTFDYEVSFPSGSDNVILIAPNGFGKTALLAVLNACLQFRLAAAARFNFQELNVTFDDGSRWNFKRARDSAEYAAAMRRPAASRVYRTARAREWVRFTSFDVNGFEMSAPADALLNLPTNVLFRAIETVLPVSRETYDTFRLMTTGDVLTVPEIIEKYRDRFLNDDDFRAALGPRIEGLLRPDDEKVNCVFIETQRLLHAARSAERQDGEQTRHEEEITRQSQHLSALLQGVYSSYASISQDLDRSFPNRLISRAASAYKSELNSLRSDLESIEGRRKALTDAGILVESAAPIVAPKDEFLGNVADALEIYVEDSRKKLSIFDEIFPKVSVFRDLMNKKFRPKELIIGRQSGIFVQRGDKNINLEGLSSGEKHEFIMLFRLIFETPDRSLVLIDEPEISLHVVWQMEFMSDLQSIQKANPFQAIIATHSPQIFQGMDDFIVDLADQAS